MPRRSFPDVDAPTVHVVNRAAHEQLLFASFGEYLLFVRLLERTLRLAPVALYGFALMPNHFHLIVGVADQRQLSVFMHLLTMTHARLLRQARGTVGRGALYQGRFRARYIDTEQYFYLAMRYVARNPVRAGFVTRVEDWPWSSESPIAWVQGVPLAEWPLPRPSDWRAFINDVESEEDLAFFRGGINATDAPRDRRQAADPAIVDTSVMAVSGSD